jgi:16S rRNA (uracil1498-N3)-methyltransferase
MLPRFYAPDLDRAASVVTLPADEARHLTRVLRMKAGDELTVFDGRGAEFRAVVDVAVRETVAVRLVESVPPPAPLPFEITVVQAILKGASMDDAVRDATMMGAAAIHPVLSEHTDVKAAFVKRPETVERWRRVALAAVKQSRRATLAEVHATVSFDAWLRTARQTMTLLFVEPSVNVKARPLKEVMDQQSATRVAVLLGPEGGWAADEVEAALASGCVAVTLGPLTLRAESMPVAALAALHALAP